MKCISNSPSMGDFFVAPVLESSHTHKYAPVLWSRAPINPLIARLFKTHLWMVFVVCAFFASLVPMYADATEEPVQRVILALYDSKEERNVRFSRTHRILDMPLNHLGYIVRYHDMRDPLPEIGPEIHGVLLWLVDKEDVTDPDLLLNWLHGVLDKQRKLVVIGLMGIGEGYRRSPDGIGNINKLLRRIGIEDRNQWFGVTYQSKMQYEDPAIMNFERRVAGVLPAYMHMVATADATVHLSISNIERKQASDIIVTHPNGGYISGNYVAFASEKDGQIVFQQLYLNPFEYFRQAFDAQDIPKADTTTLSGRRIFYSHLDGDAWNNVTELEEFRNQQVFSSEVLKRKIFGAYPHLCFSVGVIVSEIDPQCFGFDKSAEVAREIFALPNVEPTSHTHSHPLYWRYFADGNPIKELALLKNFPDKPRGKRSLMDAITSIVDSSDPWQALREKTTPEEIARLAQQENEKIIDGLGNTSGDILKGYGSVARSYACEPFDIEREISGAADYINALTPEGKQVKLVQWSGDTWPFEKAIRLAREAGLRNINGGDARFDSEFPSYTAVAPVGLEVGAQRQIYSSNSNENIYTKEWTDRFFGFKYLISTVRNTEAPIRVKPFNIYFHSYSGEKEASLNALQENLAYAVTQPIIPIFTSDFAAIADGFYSTQFVKIGEDRWKILHRDGLQTIRFDKATLKHVNFDDSQGVIGQRYYQGSLYVALDAAVESPVISLENIEKTGGYGNFEQPYLIESRWAIKDLISVKKSLIFAAHGFGPGAMVWKMPENGTYQIQIMRDDTMLSRMKVDTDEHGLLTFVVDVDASTPLSLTLLKL